MKLLIISNLDSQLSWLLEKSFDACDRVNMAALASTNLDAYDAFALLGGVEAGGAMLMAPDRNALSTQMRKGKRIFAEYCRGIGQVSFLDAVGTRFERPVLLHAQAGIAQMLTCGTIFDEQSNQRMTVYHATNDTNPILQYVANPEGFYAVSNTDKIKPDLSHFALWLDEPTLLVCSFRMAFFSSAKFAPRNAWISLLSDIIAWLGGQCPAQCIVELFASAYTMGQETDLRTVMNRSIGWFRNANVLITRMGKPYAVYEGLTANVSPEGTHTIASELRLDCVGEASFMFYLKYLLDENSADLETADGLYRFPLDMQVTEACPEQGMLRCSLSGWWNVNYQDDTSRGFLLPFLWRAFLSGDKTYLPRIKQTLEYLLKSTGIDGLRAIRLDFHDMYSSELKASGLQCLNDGQAYEHAKWSWGGGVSGITTMGELHAKPAGTPSAHYNAYYMASLLLAYRLIGEKKYLETATCGLSTIMRVYPNTAREHSETQEMCRLILPLALLFWNTKDDIHREWLYRVAKDLQRVRHSSGGYLEWDTGYTAICSNVKEGESSAFSTNGDPVCDMLYTINWLPFSYMVAYFVTKDPYFYTLWQDITSFFASVQIHSNNPMIDGAWTRAVDMNLMEVYGVPNDIGWSPWSVESGWTMAEVTSGMLLGLLKGKIMPLFDADIESKARDDT